MANQAAPLPDDEVPTPVAMSDTASGVPVEPIPGRNRSGSGQQLPGLLPGLYNVVPPTLQGKVSRTSMFWATAPPAEIAGDTAAEVAWLERMGQSDEVGHGNAEVNGYEDSDAPSPKGGRVAVTMNSRGKRPTILDEQYVLRYTQVMAKREVAQKGEAQINVTVPTSNGVKSEHYSGTLKAEEMIEMKHLPRLETIWLKSGQTVNRETFVKVLHETLDPHVTKKEFELQMSLLFYRMDTNSDGSVDWDEFCTHLMLSLEEKFQVELQRDYPLLICPRIFPCPHHVAIRRLQYYGDPVNRFVSFDDIGVVCIWGAKMDLLRTVHLPDTKSTGSIVRVTDGGYLPSCNVFVVASTNSDIRFYDGATELLYKSVIVGDMVTTVSVWNSPAGGDASAAVAFGTMNGMIHLLKFPNATRLDGMFNIFTPMHWQDPINIRIVDVMQHYPILNAPSAVEYAGFLGHKTGTASELDGSVGRIAISEDGELVFSCSKAQKSSFAITRTDKFSEAGVHVVRVHKGVDCFDHSPELNQVATGGKDCQVRLWNPYVPNNTLAELRGHGAPIVALQFNSTLAQLITLTANETIRIWDIEQRICLNALAEIIPHNLIVKAAATDMLWHSATQSLITLTKDEIAIIQMTRDQDRRAFTVTDCNSVACMCLLEALNYLCTGSTGGTIATWKADTGEKMLEFGEEGGAAITAVCPGDLSSRLVSSDANGRLVVWNVLAGSILQILRPIDMLKEISGIVSFKSTVFAAGWSRRLMKFEVPREVALKDCPMLVDEPPLRKIFGPSHHEDIACVNSLQEAYVITGSYDGVIVVWDFRTGAALQNFDSRTCTKFLEKQTKWSIHLPTVAEVHSPSINAMLTLEARVNQGMADKLDMAYVASLVVSSDNGILHFYQPVVGTLLGAFRIAVKETQNDIISALATDETDSVLFTGNTHGYLNVFDITNVCVAHPIRKAPGVQNTTPKPKLLHAWRAHTQPITSLQFVSHESFSTIVSSATDGSVRLWSPSGEYLGTFGSGMYALMANAVDQYQALLCDIAAKSEAGLAWGRAGGKLTTLQLFGGTLSAVREPGQKSRRVSFIPQETADQVLEYRNKIVDNQQAEADLKAKAVLAQMLEEEKVREESITNREEIIKKSLSVASVLAKTRLDKELEVADEAKRTGHLREAEEELHPLTQPLEMDDDGMSSRTPQFTSRLGKVFDKRLHDRCRSRKKWRDATPRPNTAKATLSGTNICQPFSALGLERSELEDVNPDRSRPGQRRSRTRGTSMWGVAKGASIRPASAASAMSDGPPRIPKLTVVTSPDKVQARAMTAGPAAARITSMMATAALAFAAPGLPSGHHRSKSAAAGVRVQSLAALASLSGRHPAPISPTKGGGGRRSGPLGGLGHLLPTNKVSPKKRGRGVLGGFPASKPEKLPPTPSITVSESSLPRIRGAKC